jgi:Protein of unknown function (DUF3592)
VLEIAWKIIRGIHRWPEAEARVTFACRYTARSSKGRMLSKVVIGFRYRTLDGQEFAGNYGSTDSSPLYGMSEGDTFSLSYNPKRPERYWSDLYGLGLGELGPLLIVLLIGFVTILIQVATSK